MNAEHNYKLNFGCESSNVQTIQFKLDKSVTETFEMVQTVYAMSC